MTHIPLNGPSVLHRAARAMTPKPSAAALLRSAIAGDDEAPGGIGSLPDDAPDGTGASTKSYPARASDPSQGHGDNTRPGPVDPLTATINRIVNRR